MPLKLMSTVDSRRTTVDFISLASCSSAVSAHIQYEVPQPRLFSFNNPFGACPTCHGFGNIIELDMNLVVPDQSKSVHQDAIEPWSKPHYRSRLAELKRAARGHGVRMTAPWSELSEQERHFIIEGDGHDYEGIKGFFRWLERKKYKVHVRVIPQSVSRLPDLSELRGGPVASGSPRRARWWMHDRRGVRSDGHPGRVGSLTAWS